MAEKKASGRKPRLKEDDIVRYLVRDGADGSDAILLTGFLGRGRRSGCWRLYRAPELRDFVEFREEDIVYCQKTDSDQLPATGTLVWIRSDAILEHHQAASRSVAAEFLSGEIIDDRADRGFDSLIATGQTAITWTITWTVTITVTTTLVPKPKCDHSHPHPESLQSHCLCPD